MRVELHGDPPITFVRRSPLPVYRLRVVTTSFILYGQMKRDGLRWLSLRTGVSPRWRYWSVRSR